MELLFTFLRHNPDARVPSYLGGRTIIAKRLHLDCLTTICAPDKPEIKRVNQTAVAAGHLVTTPLRLYPFALSHLLVFHAIR